MWRETLFGRQTCEHNSSPRLWCRLFFLYPVRVACNTEGNGEEDFDTHFWIFGKTLKRQEKRQLFRVSRGEYMLFHKFHCISYGPMCSFTEPRQVLNTKQPFYLLHLIPPRMSQRRFNGEHFFMAVPGSNLIDHTKAARQKLQYCHDPGHPPSTQAGLKSSPEPFSLPPP